MRSDFDAADVMGNAAEAVGYRALVVLVAAASLCACNGHSAGGDPSLDAGARWPQLDATLRDAPPPVQRDAPVAPPPQIDAAPCSLGPSPQPPAPTHRAQVAYDNFVYCEHGFGLQGAFIDANGLAIFGEKGRLRVSLDGALLSHHSNPVGPYMDVSILPYWVVSAGDRYGVIAEKYIPTGSQRYFCVITDEGFPDVDQDCDDLGVNGTWAPELAWDGESFFVFGSVNQNTRYVRRYDRNGQFIDQREFAGRYLEKLNPVMLPQTVVMTRELPRTDPGHAGCTTTRLNTWPLTFDPAGSQTWELLPDDFKQDLPAKVAGNGNRAAVLNSGICFQHFPPYPADDICNQNWPPDPPWVYYLTIVDAQGDPLLLRERIATYGIQVLWDGTQFLLVSYDAQSSVGSAVVLSLDAFDQDGSFTMWGAKPLLTYSYSPHRLEWAQVVAVAPNDYIIVYVLSDTGELYVARVYTTPL
ncbi:MAG TPA: hypothetical protein VGQ83_18980 [Polyangia bacterium]